MSIIDGYELDDLRDKAARTERAEAAMENEAIVTRELKAEIERLRQEAADAKEDALRLHSEKMRYFDALLEMRCRDDRNGSLHKNYRDIIDGALGDEQETKEAGK